MKSSRSRKLPVIVLSFVLVLVLGFAVQYLYRTYRIVQPINQDFMNITGVEAFQFDDAGTVTVQLGEVDDLQETFHDIREAAGRTLGEDLYRIIVIDRRTPELEKVYHQIHFHLYQGIATGRFTEMVAAIETTLATYNVQGHKIAIDTNYLFLQLHGKDGFLYEIIPRRPEAPVGIAVERGRSSD